MLNTLRDAFRMEILACNSGETKENILSLQLGDLQR
jgi:hypothetical protein